MTKLTGAILSADVEVASAPKMNEGKGFIHVTLPIGTASNIECWVYDEQKDAAAVTNLIVEETRKATDVRLFAPTDVYVAGEHAVLASHAIYLADVGGVKGAGELKLAYYNHPLTPTLCSHDEAGYSATFGRVTKRGFETARRSDRELRGKRSTSWEVSVVKIDGRPVGFEDRTTYEDAASRQRTSTTLSSGLYQRSATACRSQDSASTVTVSASGELLQHETAVSNGQDIELKVALKRVSAAQYAYSGQVSGKPIVGKFKTADKAGLATSKRIAANVKDQLLSGKAASFSVEEYTPSVDATAPVVTVYEIVSKDERTVTASIGPMKLTAVVDVDGDATKVQLPVGNATVTVERLAAGGKR